MSPDDPTSSGNHPRPFAYCLPPFHDISLLKENKRPTASASRVLFSPHSLLRLSLPAAVFLPCLVVHSCPVNRPSLLLLLLPCLWFFLCHIQQTDQSSARSQTHTSRPRLAQPVLISPIHCLRGSSLLTIDTHPS